ncbi:otoferlin-like [Periplaneta americana]|uniref:otoferlin-like n=1 Tax=Periplaneta americana TaxID=6978 RepID=UPI0037E8EC75
MPEFFQISVTIIEAKHLAWPRMDPIVCVQVGDKKKYTAMKENTDCPYYNEYFVFDFHLPFTLLLDQVITLSVMQARTFGRPKKILGQISFDVATVWQQPDHQFYHKWAVLLDQNDEMTGARGYLKCDVSVIGKGDTIKKPPTAKDEDDIEGNLLVPEGVTSARQRARYVVRVYRADSIPATVIKKTLIFEAKDHIDPYVRVSFAGLTGRISVKNNCSNPVWNEELIFSDLFPPLWQRIRIELCDSDLVGYDVIATHLLDLPSISCDQDTHGFVPTFGPAFLHLYGPVRMHKSGSPRGGTESYVDALSEDAAYKGRLLLAVETELLDSGAISTLAQTTKRGVIRRPFSALVEKESWRMEEFLLVGVVWEISMLDPKLINKPVKVEISLGSLGNSATQSNPDAVAQDRTGEMESLTPSQRPVVPEGSCYGSVSFGSEKPCVHVMSTWPDARHRMFHSNLLVRLAHRLSLNCSRAMSGENNEQIVQLIRLMLSQLNASCAKYLAITSAQHYDKAANTKLDKMRRQFCRSEVEKIMAASIKVEEELNKAKLNSVFVKVQHLLQRLKLLIEDPQHALPDVFIWLVAGDKPLAFHKVPARELIFSVVPEERGMDCGSLQSILLKTPEKRDGSGSSWSVPAKLDIALWLGHSKHMHACFNSLPRGYEPIDGFGPHQIYHNSQSTLPAIIRYTEKHNFQCRAYIYQGRLKPGYDKSALCDPFVRVVVGTLTKDTQVIKATLDPTWDETLVLGVVTFQGSVQSIQQHPPTIVMEVLDLDDFGKKELVGRITVKPRVKLAETPYYQPRLEWYSVYNGSDLGGDILAAFELLELSGGMFGLELPQEKVGKQHVLRVPPEIKPHLADYRMEVLFWGLRDLKRLRFLTIKKPLVVLQCNMTEVRSSVLTDVKQNLNFSEPLKMTLLLDTREEYETKMKVVVFPQQAGTSTEEVLPSDVTEDTPLLPPRKARLSLSEMLEDDSNGSMTSLFENYKEDIENKPGGLFRSTRGDRRLLKKKKATLKIYQNELESQPEFNNFKDTLQSFDIFRGKKTGDDYLDRENVVCKLKGTLRLYRWPPPEGSVMVTSSGLDVEQGGVLQDLRANDSLRIVVRIYVISGIGLHSKDISGKSDPYILIKIGSRTISDRENYIPRQLNPVFGRYFEMEAMLPIEHMLTIRVMDYDVASSDDLIGETKIDLEDRFYSKHRATCGLARMFDVVGYNRWRDVLKPSQILEDLCKKYNLSGPKYFDDRVVIGPQKKGEENFHKNSTLNHKEELALYALRRWHEVPLVGCHLVPEHIETRSLFNPKKPGLEQGKLEMWVDIFPLGDLPLPPPIDISIRKPQEYELRVIVWNTEDVILQEENILSGERMSDIYVSGSLLGKDDTQYTDVHYRSLTGEGNFNWRFVFRFNYLPMEKKLVILKKESLISSEVTEHKMPCNLKLQVWDNDKFSSDDFLGFLTLELPSMPRGARTAKNCTLDIMSKKNSIINLFKIRRTKGWWPFQNQPPEGGTPILTGKLEAELQIFTVEEADKNPVGLGRSAPESLPQPKRPETSFLWFKNPMRSLKFICWRQYKWAILKLIIVILVTFIILAGIYSFPGYGVKKLLRA